jgi:anti-anti-sigma factor
MAIPSGIIRVNQLDRVLTVHVEGRATMAHSLSLRRFAEQELARGATGIRINLRACTYMDSTFLGTLLLLKRLFANRGPHALVLVAPSCQCTQLLQQMKLDQLFEIIPAEEAGSSAGVELPGHMADLDAFQSNALQAHQELARLPGDAGQSFRLVVQCLEEELAAKKRS